MCIHVQSITYMHPDKDVLFSNVSFTISKGQKVALIGNNGSGKSTLMRLITKELLPSEGQIICPDIPYSIPQHFGQFNHLTVAGALGIERKLYALHAILQGDASIEHFTALADDWEIEEKAVAALNEWGLVGVPLSYPMHHAAAGCGETGRCGKYPLGEGGGGVGGAGRTLGNRSDLPVFLRRLHFANRPRFHCLRFSSISFFTSSLAAQ